MRAILVRSRNRVSCIVFQPVPCDCRSWWHGNAVCVGCGTKPIISSWCTESSEILANPVLLQSACRQLSPLAYFSVERWYSSPDENLFRYYSEHQAFRLLPSDGPAMYSDPLPGIFWISSTMQPLHTGYVCQDRARLEACWFASIHSLKMCGTVRKWPDPLFHSQFRITSVLRCCDDLVFQLHIFDRLGLLSMAPDGKSVLCQILLHNCRHDSQPDN